MQFPPTLLFLLSNAIVGLAMPMSPNNAAAGQLEQRGCLSIGEICSNPWGADAGKECCSGYCMARPGDWPMCL